MHIYIVKLYSVVPIVLAWNKNCVSSVWLNTGRNIKCWYCYLILFTYQDRRESCMLIYATQVIKSSVLCQNITGNKCCDCDVQCMHIPEDCNALISVFVYLEVKLVIKDGSSCIVKMSTVIVKLLHCTMGTHNLICLFVSYVKCHILNCKLTTTKKCSRYQRYLEIPTWFLNCSLYKFAYVL